MLWLLQVSSWWPYFMNNTAFHLISKFYNKLSVPLSLPPSIGLTTKKKYKHCCCYIYVKTNVPLHKNNDCFNDQFLEKGYFCSANSLMFTFLCVSGCHHNYVRFMSSLVIVDDQLVLYLLNFWKYFTSKSVFNVMFL